MKKSANHNQGLKTEKEYQKLMTKGKKNHQAYEVNIKTVNWQNGEKFELFTLFKNVSSGTTTTDSCLTSN